MSDLVWFIVIAVLFIAIGTVFCVLGLQIWKKQRTDLIISYHCDKVGEENKRAFCTLFGSGLIIMGIGFAISGICSPFVRSALSFVPMACGLITGLILLGITVIKYNR